MEREESSFPWQRRAGTPTAGMAWCTGAVLLLLHQQKHIESDMDNKWGCLPCLASPAPSLAGVGQSEGSWGHLGSVGGCSDPHTLLWGCRSAAGREGEDPSSSCRDVVHTQHELWPRRMRSSFLLSAPAPFIYLHISPCLLVLQPQP